MYRYVNVEVLVRRSAILRVAVNARSFKISNLYDLFRGGERRCGVLVVRRQGRERLREESRLSGERRPHGASWVSTHCLRQSCCPEIISNPRLSQRVVNGGRYAMRHLLCLAVCVYHDIWPSVNLHRVGSLSQRKFQANRRLVG